MNFLTSSFFRRLLLVLLTFTALVVYGYSELISSSMKAAENRTVQEYLRAEYALFTRQYAETGSGQLPSTDNLSAWWGDDADLPASYADFEPGIHKLKRSKHLLVAEPAGAHARTYFVLSEPGPGSTQMIRSEMESTIYLAASIVLLSGAILAVLVARLMSRPVRELAEDVQSGWEPGKELQGHNRNDEIGLLSRALGDLFNRMESALAREKSVTRYASHDMRTPVSVIRVALSVLNMPECDEAKRVRNLKRIDEACADIEDRIEVHLCLARASAELPEENCDVRVMVADEFAKHRHTIDARKLEFAISGGHAGFLAAPPMLRIVLSNLIQNAVKYSEGTIHAVIAAEGFEIRNSSAAIDAQGKEGGLGLEIIQRVCDYNRWNFSAGLQGNDFVAGIVFHPERGGLK